MERAGASREGVSPPCRKNFWSTIRGTPLRLLQLDPHPTRWLKKVRGLAHAGCSGPGCGLGVALPGYLGKSRDS